MGYEMERRWAPQDVTAGDRGFDILSKEPKTGAARFIEVKGRATVGDIILTKNEHDTAERLTNDYWLYVVFNCAGAHPELHRVRDPFGKLIARAKGGVVLDAASILQSAERQ